MKKEFGKWLMDVAKYLATVVLISSIFEEAENIPAIYWGAIFSLCVLLGFGLLLVREPEKPETKKVKNRR